MTGQEMRSWLRRKPFEPFQIRMNNGEIYEVRHPEFALIAETGALYIYEPAKEEPADVTGHPMSCDIRNICTVEPLPAQHA